MSNKESARQEDVFIAVSESPDPCKTPPANIPIPYRIVAKLGGSLSVSPNVKYQGRPVLLADQSSIDKVEGDEAGSGGGVTSGTKEGEVKFIEGSSTVRVNGKRIVREKDQVSMNNGNTTGRIQNLSGSAPAGGVTPEGKPMRPANPPRDRTPEAPSPGRPRLLDHLPEESQDEASKLPQTLIKKLTEEGAKRAEDQIREELIQRVRPERHRTIEESDGI